MGELEIVKLIPEVEEDGAVPDQFAGSPQSVLVLPVQVVAAKLLKLPDITIKINIIKNLFILNVYYIIKTTKKAQ